MTPIEWIQRHVEGSKQDRYRDMVLQRAKAINGLPEIPSTVPAQALPIHFMLRSNNGDFVMFSNNPDGHAAGWEFLVYMAAQRGEVLTPPSMKDGPESRSRTESFKRWLNKLISRAAK